MWLFLLKLSYGFLDFFFAPSFCPGGFSDSRNAVYSSSRFSTHDDYITSSDTDFSYWAFTACAPSDKEDAF
jgi:hypothetical protein